MFGAVILAGGKGTRFGGQKQFMQFRGKELWLHVFEKAVQCVDESHVVVVGKDVAGGGTRSESVRIGLNFLPNDTERVIILEAARPLVTRRQIEALLADRHASVSFVMPLVNTVVFRNGTYLDRNGLYELLTPQAFDFHLLKTACNSGAFPDMTDETRVMYEFYGTEPFFIETGRNLIKVTYPKDLEMLECLSKEML